MSDQEKFDEEQVYDEKIAPLMKQIIAICQEHRLPFIASFNYANRDGDPDGPSYCTSVINPPGRRSDAIEEMRRVIYQPARVLALTITGPRKESP